MAIMPSEELRTILWMFVTLITEILNFETVLHAQKNQWRGPAKFVGIPKTWNHLEVWENKKLPALLI